MEAWDHSVTPHQKNWSLTPLGVNNPAFLSYGIRLQAMNRDFHHPAELPFSVTPGFNDYDMVQEY